MNRLKHFFTPEMNLMLATGQMAVFGCALFSPWLQLLLSEPLSIILPEKIFYYLSTTDLGTDFLILIGSMIGYLSLLMIGYQARILVIALFEMYEQVKPIRRDSWSDYQPPFDKTVKLDQNIDALRRRVDNIELEIEKFSEKISNLKKDDFGDILRGK